MRKSIILGLALWVLLFGSECLAYRPAVIGGIRGGAALGLMVENGLTVNSALRMGFEAR